jgi:hypothetical protein
MSKNFRDQGFFFMEGLDDAAKLGSPVSETEKKSVVEIVIKWRRQGFKL